jgi:anthraniloyl-CoA monooxygenase
MEAAFQRYQDERRVEVLRLQSAARNSLEWFEQVERYLDMPPMQFAYSLLTRSQRISHENLRLRDPEWLRRPRTGSRPRPAATGPPADVRALPAARHGR